MSRAESVEHLIGAERLAMLRQVMLFPLDLTDVVPEARPGDDVVVLVHGFLASAGVFRPMRARLEREARVRVATFTHAPGAGVVRIAWQLARLVDRLPAGVHVTVVGHSLGGVVARWYVQELGGDARIGRTVSLGSPFGGVDVFWGMDVPHFAVGADVCQGSRLLARLRERASSCPVPHTSIVAGDDLVVPGRDTACLGCGDVIVLPGCGHNSLLFDETVARHILEMVRQREPDPLDRREGRPSITVDTTPHAPL